MKRYSTSLIIRKIKIKITRYHLTSIRTHACMLSHFIHVQLFGTPWTVACQVPLSMGFSRQEYWSGLPFPPPEDLPHLGIKPAPLKSPKLAGRFFTTSAICQEWPS